MLSGFLVFGVFVAALAASLAALSALGTRFYLRVGPRRGFATLALFGVLGTILLDFEFAAAPLLSAFVLAGGVQRGWNFSKNLWAIFLALAVVTTLRWAIVFWNLGDDAFAMLRERLLEVVEALRNAPGQLWEMNAPSAEEFLRASYWWISALPGYNYARDFFLAFFAPALLEAIRPGTWQKGEAAGWRVPWYLVWLFLACGFGLLAGVSGWKTFPRAAEIAFASGFAVSGAFFLLQGTLVAWALLGRLGFPRWAGVLGLLLFWRTLPVLGLADVWLDTRTRLAQKTGEKPPL